MFETSAVVRELREADGEKISRLMMARVRGAISDGGLSRMVFR
jgi:hypothetical protein